MHRRPNLLCRLSSTIESPARRRLAVFGLSIRGESEVGELLQQFDKEEGRFLQRELSQ